jgi:hypothetical protein
MSIIQNQSGLIDLWAIRPPFSLPELDNRDLWPVGELLAWITWSDMYLPNV